MGLTDEERARLADVVRLQPTKNKELQDRWGMDSGSEVHQYLESNLKDYYYRDENSLIRATDEAAELVDVEPGVETGAKSVPSVIRVPELQAQVYEVLAGPDERSESVVSVLNKVRESFGVDPTAEEVRESLQALRRKSVVEVVYRTVPTFRLAVERDSVDVEALAESTPSATADESESQRESESESESESDQNAPERPEGPAGEADDDALGRVEQELDQS